MLHHVNKLYCILLIVVVVSCNRELSSEQLRQMRERAYHVSINTVGSDSYWTIYKAMNDSVKVWAENELGFYRYLNRDSIDYGAQFQIDSLLCFNVEKNMCFTAILRQMTEKDAPSDDIWHFFGIKINGQWYFFRGATLILPRDFYQKENYPPLSFDKLKELAMKHLFQTYLRKSQDGEWVINDAFFNDYYKYDAVNRPVTTEAERDSSWLRACERNWSRRNKN